MLRSKDRVLRSELQAKRLECRGQGSECESWRAIAQFREKFPGVGIALSEFDHYSEVEQTLRNGQAEVGFVLLPAAAEFEVWTLCRDEFVALLPPTAVVQDAALTWEQLASYLLIMTPVASPHIHAA